VTKRALGATKKEKARGDKKERARGDKRGGVRGDLIAVLFYL
jgi:hypothetical protein